LASSSGFTSEAVLTIDTLYRRAIWPGVRRSKQKLIRSDYFPPCIRSTTVNNPSLCLR